MFVVVVAVLDWMKFWWMLVLLLLRRARVSIHSRLSKCNTKTGKIKVQMTQNTIESMFLVDETRKALMTTRVK
jgi:hypothetical protein